MDIHKPKPLHGWRELVSEIAVIVVGILIALGLEQAVESLHWRHQVENARSGLGSELSETVGQARERVRVSQCVDRRLDVLAGIVDTAAQSGRLPAVGDIGMPPARTWSTGVWQSTLDGQTSEHLRSDLRNAFSVIYGFVNLLSSTNGRELEAWTRLYALVGPGRALSPGEAAALRTDISQARMLNQVMGLGAVRVDQMTNTFHVELNRGFMKTFDQPASTYAICMPIGPAPTHYGAAPMSNSIARARSAGIGRGVAARAIAGAR